VVQNVEGENGNEKCWIKGWNFGDLVILKTRLWERNHFLNMAWKLNQSFYRKMWEWEEECMCCRVGNWRRVYCISFYIL
jgi:hypothetical protein